jgi:hypothetical protein
MLKSSLMPVRTSHHKKGEFVAQSFMTYMVLKAIQEEALSR